MGHVSKFRLARDLQASPLEVQNIDRAGEATSACFEEDGKVGGRQKVGSTCLRPQIIYEKR